MISGGRGRTRGHVRIYTVTVVGERWLGKLRMGRDNYCFSLARSLRSAQSYDPSSTPSGPRWRSELRRHQVNVTLQDICTKSGQG